MNILLVGEYSRLHNSLKEGLELLGHKVVIAGSGDYFKNYPVDIDLSLKFRKGILSLIKKFIFKLFHIDISSLAFKNTFKKNSHLLNNYDIVQLINENPFNTQPKIEQRLLSFLFNNNKKVFLLSCGLDYISVKHASDGKFRYSILTPYLNKKASKKEFHNELRRLNKDYIKLHKYIFSNIKGIISSDLDYHIPLLNHDKYLGLIPNPINIDKLQYTPLSLTKQDCIIIFHGINSAKYFKKGNDIFEKALDIISNKFNNIEIITTRDIPYKEYIKYYDSCHILLDQIYAYDQGYNALEAMAKGKVVFTGAEQEWLDYYNLKQDTVAINALPDVNKIVEKLEWLILNPDKINEISKNARAFIEKEHHYFEIAKKYITVWQS